jgi:hypothetical protein
MYVYLPNLQKNVIITNCGVDAGSVVLNITNVDGSSINLSGYSWTTANPMIFHSNADYYRLTLTPVDGSSNHNVIGTPIVEIVRPGTNSNNIILEATVPVFVGAYYSVTIEAVNGNDISSGKVGLNYGFESFTYSFSKFTVSVSNTNPMLMKFPNDPTTPTITMNGVAPGLISISVTSGWTNADSYLILWHDTNDTSQKTAILPKGLSSPPIMYLSATPGTLCTATVMPLVCGQIITSSAQTVTANCPSFPASSFHLAPYYWLGAVSQSGTSAPQIVTAYGTNMTGIILNRSNTGVYTFGCNEFLSNRVVHKLIFFTHNSGGNPSSSWGSYDTWDLASGSGVGYIYTFNSSGVLSDGLLNGTLMVLGG